MLTSLLCAALLCPGAALAVPASEEPLVTRSFSLSDLRATAAAEYDAVSPYPFAADDGDDVHHAELHEIDLHAPLEELIYEVVAPDEFEYEGRMLWLSDDDRLFVRAPARVVERVTGVVDYLRAALDRRVELELTVRELLPVGGDPGADPAVGDVVYSERRAVSLERTISFGAPVARTLVRGWDTEIAQQSVTAAPDTGVVLDGLELLLRVEQAGGDGYRVRHAARIADLVDVEERDTARLERVLLDGHTWQGGGDRVHLPTVGLACTAGSQVLRAGDALAQSLWMRTDAGWRGWRLEVGLVSAQPAPEPLVVGDFRVHVLQASRYLAPTLRVERPRAHWLRPGENHGGRFDRLDEPPHVHLVEGYSGDGLAMHAFDTSWEFEPLLVSELGSALLAAGNPEGLDRALEQLPLLEPERRNVWIEVGLGPESEPLARAELGIETGADGLLVLGDSRTLLVDFDVDVATGAAGSTPFTSDALDGLLLRVRAGDRAVRVDGYLQRLIDVGRSHGGLDLPSLARAFVDAQVPLDGRARGVGRVDGASLWVRASLR